MLFCYVFGTCGGYNQPATPEKNKVYLYKIRNCKKTSPCYSIKWQTLKPRNSPPTIKSENPTKKPYKEPVHLAFQYCSYLLFLQYFACVFMFSSVILLLVCSILHVFLQDFDGFCMFFIFLSCSICFSFFLYRWTRGSDFIVINWG